MARLQFTSMSNALKNLCILKDGESNIQETNNDLNTDKVCMFYKNLVEEVIEIFSLNRNGTMDTLRQSIKKYSSEDFNHLQEEIDYNNINNCLEYLYYHAAFHTNLVKRVMNISFCSAPRKDNFIDSDLKKTLNVVSLGGRAGVDLFGFCGALYGKHRGLNKLNMTVVDKIDMWGILLTIADETARKNFSNFSKLFRELQVTTDFIHEDLLNIHWKDELNETLKSAEIILLIKLLSSFGRSEQKTILKNLVTAMKPGSLLVFVDCIFPKSTFQLFRPHLKSLYSSPKTDYTFNEEVNPELKNVCTNLYTFIFMKTYELSESVSDYDGDSYSSEEE